MDKIVINRDGLPPIVFTGDEIGSASNHSHQGPNQNRWTVVKIFRTKGGKYVVQENYFTVWEGECDTTAAASFAHPQDVIDWLKGRTDGNGLGSVSQRAVEEAVENDEEFASIWVEEVE